MTRTIGIMMMSALALMALLLGCGGGGGGSGTDPRPLVLLDGVAQGVAQHGPIKNATIQAYRWEDGVPGALVASAITDETGAYRLDITNQAEGYLLVTSRGGEYQEEASGLAVQMDRDQLRALIYFAQSDTAQPVQLTHFTTIAACYAEYLVAQGSSVQDAARQSAEVITGYAGLPVITTRPVDVTQDASATAQLTNAHTYGLIIAGISQALETLRIAQGAVAGDLVFTSKYFTNLACDDIRADGLLDGRRESAEQIFLGGTLLDTQFYRKNLGVGLLKFANSPNNKTGIRPRALTNVADFISDNRVGLFNQVPGEPADNQGPEITNLAAYIRAFSGTATIAFDVRDDVGPEGRLDFYLQEDLQSGASPFYTTSTSDPVLQIDTRNFVDGDYEIVAVAEDVLGNVTQAPFTLTFNNTEPVISIAPSTIWGSDTYLAQGVVSLVDGVSVDRIEVNGEAAELDPVTGEWQAQVPVVSGRNSIEAIAFDSNGNSSSDSVEVLVDLDAPTITLAATQVLSKPPGAVGGFATCSSSTLSQTTQGVNTPLCLSTDNLRLNGRPISDALDDQGFILLGVTIDDPDPQNLGINTLVPYLRVEYRYLQGDTELRAWSSLGRPDASANTLYLPVTEDYLTKNFFDPVDPDTIHHIDIRVKDLAGNTGQIRYSFKLDAHITPELDVSTQLDAENLFGDGIDFTDRLTLSEQDYIVRYEVAPRAFGYTMRVSSPENHELLRYAQTGRQVNRIVEAVETVWQTRQYTGPLGALDGSVDIYDDLYWAPYETVTQLSAQRADGSVTLLTPPAVRRKEQAWFQDTLPNNSTGNDDNWIWIQLNDSRLADIPVYPADDCVGDPGSFRMSENLDKALVALLQVQSGGICVPAGRRLELRERSDIRYETVPGYPRNEFSEFLQGSYGYPIQPLVRVINADTGAVISRRAGRYAIPAQTPVHIEKTVSLPTLLELRNDPLTDISYDQSIQREGRIVYNIDTRITIVHGEPERFRSVTNVITYGPTVTTYTIAGPP